MHGNLTVDNIIIDTLSDGSFILTLGQQRQFPVTLPVGNDIIYMPPELLNSGEYSTDGDIWQLGIIFYYLLM